MDKRGQFGFNSIRIPPVKLRPIKFSNPLIRKNIKEKGRAFELKVRKALRAKGYTVSKAKSRHYDWLAKKGNKTYLVECKCTTARPSLHQVRLLVKSVKGKQPYILATKTNTGRIKLDFY
ncbi:MAG: restriction endonuclease [Nanoarchaeota archaeon]